MKIKNVLLCAGLASALFSVPAFADDEFNSSVSVGKWTYSESIPSQGVELKGTGTYLEPKLSYFKTYTGNWYTNYSAAVKLPLATGSINGMKNGILGASADFRLFEIEPRVSFGKKVDDNYYGLFGKVNYFNAKFDNVTAGGVKYPSLSSTTKSYSLFTGVEMFGKNDIGKISLDAGFGLFNRMTSVDVGFAYALDSSFMFNLDSLNNGLSAGFEYEYFQANGKGKTSGVEGTIKLHQIGVAIGQDF